MPPRFRALAPVLALATFGAACNPTENSPEAMGAAAGARAPAAPAPAASVPAVPAAAAAPGTAAPRPCAPDRAGAAAEKELAVCLAADVPALGAALGAAHAAPVVLYLDRSGSMAGFLDPSYPTRTRTDFRSVLDKLVVGLRPAAGYSYGTALKPVTPSLATFDDRGFYSDRDTEFEAALAQIARDTGHVRTHVIVGDARRGSPNRADAQFVTMRDLADRWIRAGGRFVVAASMAPFRTVQSDPSGCRTDRANDPRQTCPLYAFAFVAPGTDDAVPVAMAEAFEHVFMAPQPAFAPATVTLTAPPVAGVDVNRAWAKGPGGVPIVRVSGTAPARQWATVRAAVADSATAAGRLAAALMAGQGTTARVLARPFVATAAGARWGSVGGGATVRASPGVPFAADVITRGHDAATGLYRVDFLPTGEPSWLAAFDAAGATDVLRTYGLGRLFEGFRLQALDRAADDSAAVVRLLFVIN